MNLAGSLRSVRQSVPVALWGVGMVLSIAVVIIVLRLWGKMQGAELYVYDVFMRNLRPTQSYASRIAVVGITEQDLGKECFGHPVPDDALASLLEKILEHQPLAIGIDLIRDQSEAPDSGNLRRILENSPQTIGVNTVGDGSELKRGISPHPALDKDPSRYGFADGVEDPDGVTRRAWVSSKLHDSEVRSLALSLFATAEQRKPTTGRGLDLSQISQFAGPYALPKEDVRGAQFVLDFAGADTIHNERTVRAWDVHQGRLPPGALKDKIVLIGQTAESVKDRARTPIHRDVPGVEIHANAVDQLLRMLDGERELRYWSESTECGYIALWSAMGALVALPALRVKSSRRAGRKRSRTARGMWLFVGTITFALGAIIVIAAVAFGRKFFIPVVPPALALLGAATLMALLVYFREREAREIDRMLTEMHIPAPIVSTILADPKAFLKNGRLPGRKMTGTVLFTDLQGFASAAEGMEPAKLLLWLNQYFDQMCEAVEKPGREGVAGIISKFNGDQIMAFWGPPFDRPTEREIAADARAAVDAALEMRSRLAALNARWRDNKLPTTRMRVGIFTGDLVAGSLGGAGRLEYSVIGDSVNVASRLENCMKDLMDPEIARDGCRILIGDATRERVGDRYELRDLGEHLLAGMREKVGIYAVLGKRQAGSAILFMRGASTVKGRVE